MENAFLPRAENAFSPKGINVILDWVGINFFADQSAKQFLPARNNISGNQLTVTLWSQLIFPEILFPEMFTRYFRKSPKNIWHF